jgi:tRNA-splicing ligase RtcB
MILRKGAISAKQGEVVIIPVNMRDGSIIATGKGNPAWNYSAPHGAGRLMSRKQAKKSLKMEDFKQSMQGIFTTSLSRDTLDEAPEAYKPMNEIIANIQDTVEISKIIKPVYNFKASGD